MRLLVAIATLALGLAAASAADAGVVRAGHGHFVAHYRPVGRPAGQIFLYDWEPGVVVRAYWLPPWRNRHYFPFGRDRFDRRVRAHWVKPRPAQDFFRIWSASSVFEAPPRSWPAPRPPVIDK